MFHAFWLGSNSLKHKPKKEPSWPMFQQDHHVKGCLKYLQVRDSGVPESYQPIVMPSSLDTQHHYRECPPAVPKILTRKLFQMVKCLKFNKQDQNSKHVITNTPGKESQIYAAVVGLVQVLLLLRSSTHTHPAVPGYFFLFKGCSQGNFKIVSQSFLSLQFTEA